MANMSATIMFAHSGAQAREEAMRLAGVEAEFAAWDTSREMPQASAQCQPIAAAAAANEDDDAGQAANSALYIDDFLPAVYYPPSPSAAKSTVTLKDIEVADNPSTSACDFSPLSFSDPHNGDGSMLVAPSEHSHPLTGDATAIHDATLHQFATAPSLRADMEAAPAGAPSAPVDPLLPRDAQLAGEFVPDLASAPLNPVGTTGLDAPPNLQTALPSLDAPIALDAAMQQPMTDDMGNGQADGYVPHLPGHNKLRAFARLRFDDGSYYMHTYSIILGRNVQLAHRDMRRLARVEKLQAEGDQERAQALLHGKKRKQGTVAARSVISEAGGIVHAPVSMMPMEYQQRRQSVASQSFSSGQGESGQDIEHAPQDMLMQALPEAPDQLDATVTENPEDCPLVPIHPQHITHRTGMRGPKGISRQHAKIFFDFEQGAFCLLVLGSNGLYHEDKFLAQGKCVELSHGDTITIGMVAMTFFLPDVALTEQRYRQESGSQSRPMSLIFENGQGELESEELMDDSVSEDMSSVNPRHVYHYPAGSDVDSDVEAIGDQGDESSEGEEQYSPEPRPAPTLKLKLKNKREPPPAKVIKKGHKRKAAQEPSPEESPLKKTKLKVKESPREHIKEKEKEKEKDKEKDKDKVKPSKMPAKVPNKGPPKGPEKAPTKMPAKEPIAKEPTPKEELVATNNSEGAAVLQEAEAEIEGEEGEWDGVVTPDVAQKLKLPSILLGHPIPKRTGPGRPPKDGVMSKRQRSQLIKLAKEIEKARAAGIDPADLPMPTTKPKTARRKESNAEVDEDLRETTEKGDATGSATDKKHIKPNKPPRTPSPEMRIEDYTEEQLQRPTANYVVLIHEAISSSPSGQMNLQQIYNYIEKKYPWYKFKTTTSGWQSSVRHNLGQHDAFVKGDKEGKGYMWRVNPNVSIEKERRKRHVSPPPASHAQRPGYYPPPNVYPPYGQPGMYYPSPGIPPNATPRPPPSVVQPRLPPSLARNAESTSQDKPSYTSPWAGGNASGQPAASNPPTPYPQSSPQAPPTTSVAPLSGPYGVLYPTTAPQGPPSNYSSAGPYGGQYMTSRPSPYSTPAGHSYTPYPPSGLPSTTPASASTPCRSPHETALPVPAPPPSSQNEPHAAHPSGRYPPWTNPDLIRQLEAFRTVYLQTRIEAGEDKKVDNAIRAYVMPERAESLSEPERNLLKSIQSIPMLEQLRNSSQPIKQEDGAPTAEAPMQISRETNDAVPIAAASTAAARAADAARPPTEPQKFTPNMTGPVAPSAASTVEPAAVSAPAPTQRPSVEPLTPVPGSPALRNGTPFKRPAPESSGLAAQDSTGGVHDMAHQQTEAKTEEPA